jgi:hypothetical protein
MENDNRENFTFFKSFSDAIEQCPEEQQLSIYRAISNFALYHQEPILDGIAKLCWVLIRPILEKSWIKYNNGKHGGAPAGNKNNRFSQKSNQKLTNIQPEYNQNTTKIQSNPCRIGKDRNGTDNKKKSKKEILSFSDRQKNFKESLIPYVELYGKDMIRAFYDYWSEPTQKGVEQMRYELQKTWKVESRLRTWERRANNGK